MTQTRTAAELSIVIPTLGREVLRQSVRAIATGSVQPGAIVLSHQGPVGAMDDMLREFGAPVSALAICSRPRACPCLAAW